MYFVINVLIILSSYRNNLEPTAKVYQWYDTRREFALLRLPIEGFNSTDEFATFLISYLKSRPQVARSVFETAALSLDTDDLNLLSLELAKLFSSECRGLIDNSCVETVKNAVGPYTLKFYLNGELYKEVVQLGGIAL